MFYVTALKHSPSKRKSISRPLRPLEGDFDSTGKLNSFFIDFFLKDGSFVLIPIHEIMEKRIFLTVWMSLRLNSVEFY